MTNFRRELHTGDNLAVLRGMNSESVDLIYLDPPFNSGKQWANPIQAKGRKAMASFKDTWTLQDINKDEHELLADEYPKLAAIIEAMGVVNGGSWKSYMIYMAVRLVEMRRILKPTGSIYYHCDPVMSHGIKLLMDAVFGGGYGKNTHFRNEISWERTRTSKVAGRYGYNHDVILFYSKARKEIWNSPRTEVDKSARPPSSYKKDEDGRYYRTIDVVALPGHGGSKPMYTYKGFTPQTRWLMTRDKLEALDARGLLVFSKTGRPYRKQYWDKHPGIPVSDIWTDIAGGGQMSKKERTDYPTQKPSALLERIIAASSNEGDLVLDPFCGCATTCIAAEQLNRQWIGVDISAVAADECRRRLEESCNILFDSVQHFTKPPQRTDITEKRTPNKKLHPILYRKQKGRCAGVCLDGKVGREMDSSDLEIDHIRARKKGGLDVDSNLQLLCGNCNRIKGARGMSYLRRRWQELEQERREKGRSDSVIRGGADGDSNPPQ